MPLYVDISRPTELEFRVEVAKRFGGMRGSVSRAFEEALTLWIEKQKELRKKKH